MNLPSLDLGRRSEISVQLHNCAVADPLVFKIRLRGHGLCLRRSLIYYLAHSPLLDYPHFLRSSLFYIITATNGIIPSPVFVPPTIIL